MSDYSRCPACLQHKKKNRRLCKECIEIYGNNADDWPEWLRVLRNDTERWRYDDQQVNENEIPFADYEPSDDIEPDLDEPLLTRDRFEMAFSRDRYGYTALPYSPYDDEEMNRQYRKSNGIPEILNIDDINPDELDAELVAVF